jgi:hypothetical protein
MSARSGLMMAASAEPAASRPFWKRDVGRWLAYRLQLASMMGGAAVRCGVAVDVEDEEFEEKDEEARRRYDVEVASAVVRGGQSPQHLESCPPLFILFSLLFDFFNNFNSPFVERRKEM